MDDKHVREEFDTGVSKIRREIKSLLAHHGLYGSVTGVDTVDLDQRPDGSRIEIIARGRSAAKTFDRLQVEGCCLRVRGAVLLDITAMVDELAQPR